MNSLGSPRLSAFGQKQTSRHKKAKSPAEAGLSVLIGEPVSRTWSARAALLGSLIVDIHSDRVLLNACDPCLHGAFALIDLARPDNLVIGGL